MSWNYFATRLHGDGTETLIANEIPLDSVQVTDDLSGPGGLTSTIAPSIARLTEANGEPVFKPWQTAIYAENDGIRGGAIIADITEDGETLKLDAVGFSGYAKDRPYLHDATPVAMGINADPADLFRFLWNRIQAWPGCDLGLEIDDTTTPIRIGEEEKDVSFQTGDGQDVSFTSGPIVYSYWDTTDIGKELDDLAKDNFEYRVEHTLVNGVVKHFLRIGYPTVGRRRNDLRFVVGENLYVIPTISWDGNEFATDIQVLGAGEGRKMVHYLASNRSPGELRRIVAREYKNAKNMTQARNYGRKEIKRYATGRTITSVAITDHPNAPLGSYQVGDEIRLGFDGQWSKAQQDVWVKITSLTIDAGTSTVVASVIPLEVF